MIYVALTGIARHVIKELLAARVRTIEIRSPNNFVTLLNVKPGDKIFLTEASAPDILLGTNGLIASVMGIQTITHRVIQSNEDYYGERGSGRPSAAPACWRWPGQKSYLLRGGRVSGAGGRPGRAL